MGLYNDLMSAISDPHEQMRLIADKIGQMPSGLAQGSAVADLGATTDLVGVDGSGSNAAPLAGTETRLDDVEGKVDALLAELRTSKIIAT